MSRASVSRDSKATLCFFRARAPLSGFVFCIRRDWPWSNYIIEMLLSSPVLNNSLNLVTDKKCSDSCRGTEKKLTKIFFWLIKHRRGFLLKDLVKCSNVQWDVLFSKKAEDVCAINSTKSWTAFLHLNLKYETFLCHFKGKWTSFCRKWEIYFELTWNTIRVFKPCCLKLFDTSRR